MAYTQKYYQAYPPQQSVTFHNLQPGLKYRVRVRAIDGEGNAGPYSNPADIISGIGSTSQPSDSVQSLVVSGYPLGVKVTWNAHASAKGYEVYVTEGPPGDGPADPDPSNKAQLYYRGNAIQVLVKATSGNTVKVKVLWYDQFGRLSTGYASGQGTAQSAS